MPNEMPGEFGAKNAFFINKFWQLPKSFRAQHKPELLVALVKVNCTTLKRYKTKLTELVSYPDLKAATITIHITISRWNAILHIRLSQPVILFQQSLTVS